MPQTLGKTTFAFVTFLARAHGADTGVSCGFGQSGLKATSSDPVDSSPAFFLLGGDRQAELFLEGARDSATDGVGLPAGLGGNLGHRRALGALQQRDDLRLLGAGADRTRGGLISTGRDRFIRGLRTLGLLGGTPTPRTEDRLGNERLDADRGEAGFGGDEGGPLPVPGFAPEGLAAGIGLDLLEPAEPPADRPRQARPAVRPRARQGTRRAARHPECSAAPPLPGP